MIIKWLGSNYKSDPVRQKASKDVSATRPWHALRLTHTLFQGASGASGWRMKYWYCSENGLMFPPVRFEARTTPEKQASAATNNASFLIIQILFRFGSGAQQAKRAVCLLVPRILKIMKSAALAQIFGLAVCHGMTLGQKNAAFLAKNQCQSTCPPNSKCHCSCTLPEQEILPPCCCGYPFECDCNKQPEYDLPPPIDR